MTEDEKQRIRALFVYVIQMLKSEAEMTSKVSSELAAILGAVQGLDLTFQDVLDHKRSEIDEISDPIILANLDRYDEMIRRVESGEFL